MKNALKILFITLLILSSNNINAKISSDLWQGAQELKNVPNQLSEIVPSITSMYQTLNQKKVEIQSKIQEVNIAKNEIENINQLLNRPQIQVLPSTNRKIIQNAINSLTKSDGSGTLDNLEEVLVGIKERMNTIITRSSTTITSISTQTAIAAAKINEKKLGKTLPQRMEAVSNVLDNFGL